MTRTISAVMVFLSSIMDIMLEIVTSRERDRVGHEKYTGLKEHVRKKRVRT